MFNDKVHVEPLYLGDIIALRAMTMFPKYPLLLLGQSKKPVWAWDAFCAGWLGISGPPRCIQMDTGGEWEREIRTDLREERRKKLQFLGEGAHR